jgi:hypothetical protein
MSYDEIVGAVSALLVIGFFSFFVFMTVIANEKEKMRTDAFFKCVEQVQKENMQVCVDQFGRAER